MTLNEYKHICFLHWLRHETLPPLILDERELWNLHRELQLLPLSCIPQRSTLWETLWNQRLCNPGLHSYVNSPHSHIAVFFQYYRPDN